MQKTITHVYRHYHLPQILGFVAGSVKDKQGFSITTNIYWQEVAQNQPLYLSVTSVFPNELICVVSAFS